MSSTYLYFQSSAGSWDNLTIGQGPLSLYGTMGTAIKGTLHIPSNVSSLKLGINVGFVPTILSGPLMVTLASIKLIGPDGTAYGIYGVFYGGCTFPLITVAPSSFNNTTNPMDFTDKVSSWAGQTVTIEINACGVDSPIGSNDIAWNVSAYMIAVIPATPATVTFDVVGGGAAVPNVPIQINDLTSDYQTTITTNSNGQATITGVDVGDDLALTITFANANTINQTITVESTSETYNVTITCITGYGFSNGTCQFLSGGITSFFAGTGKYILIAAGVIGGVAVAYEVSKGVAGREEIEAERGLPQP